MKKMISAFVLTIMIATMLLVGCGKQASPIVLPAVNEIESVEITMFDGSNVSYSDKEWVEQFIEVFTQAEATTKESVQDIPNVETYGKVDISNNGGVTTIFYYIEDGKYLIEQPYQGIYETEVDIEALVEGVE